MHIYNHIHTEFSLYLYTYIYTYTYICIFIYIYIYLSLYGRTARTQIRCRTKLAPSATWSIRTEQDWAGDGETCFVNTTRQDNLGKLWYFIHFHPNNHIKKKQKKPGPSNARTVFFLDKNRSGPFSLENFTNTFTLERSNGLNIKILKGCKTQNCFCTVFSVSYRCISVLYRCIGVQYVVGV